MEEELVSVIVITYNSGETLIETLESIKNQTYSEIELIISDDHSKDDTINIAKKWLNQNKNRFVSFQIICSVKNKGVSANCNQGIFLSKGNWFKLIAGDDILMPNCILDNVEFIRDKPEISFLLSKLKLFKTGQAEKDYVDNVWSHSEEDFFEKNVNEQLNHFLAGNSIWSISLFCNRKVFNKLGGYDKKKTFIEDYPFYLKMTHKKYKVFFLDKFTVAYRIQDKSLSSRGMMVKIYDFQYWNSTLYYSFLNFKLKYILNALWNLVMLSLMKLFRRSNRISNKLYLIRGKVGLNRC